jgi:hypothetical protein
VYKTYQKKKAADLDTDEHIIHLSSASAASLPSSVHVVRELMAQDLVPVFRAFAASDTHMDLHYDGSASSSIAVLEHDDMPGKVHLFRLLTWIHSTLVAMVDNRTDVYSPSQRRACGGTSSPDTCRSSHHPLSPPS